MLNPVSSLQRRAPRIEASRAQALSKRRAPGLVAACLITGLVFAFYPNGKSLQEARFPELAALGDRRPVEPRLTGGLAYAPCSVAWEPERLLPKVSCSNALPRAVRSGSAVAGAVKALERAARRRPDDARVLSDLAAAYFVRAHQQDEPRDLVRALDAAQTARRADPSLAEACFNLALALERLHLLRLAAAEWHAYLSLDPRSRWAAEAREHLQALERPGSSETWNRDEPVLHAAALRADGDQARRIVEASPQLAREHLFERVLGNWGDAVEAGDSAAADDSLRIAFAIGRALLSINGDSLALQAAEALERAGTDPAHRRELARGHRALRAALAAYRLHNTGEAAGSFTVARVALERGGSPLYLWALCGLARYWAYEGRYDEARWAYRFLLAEAERRGFVSLAGWTQWGLLWVEGRQGHPTEALSRARAMVDLYSRVREDENLGAGHLMVGDGLFLLGQDRAGWRHLHQALQALAEFPTGFRRHVLLQRAATAGQAAGLFAAGLAFQDESLRIAQESRNPIRLTETRCARARILGALGHPRQALAELGVARREAGPVPQDATGRKLRADLLWAEAEISLLVDPRLALEPFSRALDEYGRLQAFSSVAYASFGRSRAERALGLDRSAEAALEVALRLVEDPAANIRLDDLGLSYAESIQDLYDEAILAAWEGRGPAEALAMLERSRAVVRRSGEAPSKPGPPPSGGVVVAYALLGDRLLIWRLDRRGMAAWEQRIESEAVEDMVGRFVAAIQRGDEADTRDLATHLHDLLIPPPVGSLPEDQVIHFVPDKILNQLPFAALRDRGSGRLLAEDHPLAFAPSVAQLRAGERTPADASFSRPPTALLVGNPAFDREVFRDLSSLPGAEAEIDAARGVFGGSLVLQGQEATTPRVLAELDRFDVFAFAGHAVANASLPSRSYLVLAPRKGSPEPGILPAETIGRLKLRRLRLVVLSACSSAGPRETRSAGLAGLARPFLEAGARTVVGTLWDVKDLDTAGLLADFHRAVAGGTPPVQALREAQLAGLRRGDSTRLWSAFIAVGTD